MTLPRHVTVHFTSRCNLNCRYCHTAAGNRDNEKSLDRGIVDNLIHCDCISSVSLAGGEPLICRDEMWQFVLQLRNAGIEGVTITTNGTTLWPEDVNRCLEQHVRLQFSFDGSEEVHDRIRGKGKYRTSMDALRRCREAGIRCDVLYTASKETLSSAPTLIRSLDDLGIQTITFLHFSPKGRGAFHPHADLMRHEWQTFIDNLCAVRSQTTILVQPGGLPRAQFRSLDSRRQIALCNWYKMDFAYIDIREATIYPCGLSYNTPIRIGSLCDGRMDEVIKRHLDKDLPTVRPCLDCEDYERCRGGARCIAYWTTGNMTDPDPRCFRDDWIPICPFVSLVVAGPKKAVTTLV